MRCRSKVGLRELLGRKEQCIERDPVVNALSLRLESRPCHGTSYGGRTVPLPRGVAVPAIGLSRIRELRRPRKLRRKWWTRSTNMNAPSFREVPRKNSVSKIEQL
jgi:hypothetical protein